MKKIYFFTLMLALGFMVVACTPQAQEQATDALTEKSSEVMEDDGDAMKDDGTSMKVPAPGVDPSSVDEMIVNEDGEAMKDDGDAITDDGDAMEAQTKVFNVGGVNFAFDVKEIRVKKGDTVTINFTSDGGFHDWTVAEFNAATSRVNSGGSTSVTFVADKAGTFEYYCSVGSHRALGMVGNLIVE